MSATAAARPAVSDLDEARLKKLLAERRAEASRLAEADAKLADLCRKWSGQHGYPVILRPEQMLRAIEAGHSEGSAS